MKPMPNPIPTIRQVIRIITVLGRSGKRLLRLTVPVISMITAIAQEIRRKS